jgi:aminoglycoside 3-N-acetyltransferase
MGLSSLSRAALDDALRAVGVGQGDGLLVHSALQVLGKPEGGPQMYLDALLAAIGPQGTLAVPTFNFAFARGIDFDPAETPSEGMGVFSEFVRQQPNALRSTHPMQSLAFIGAKAAELASLDTQSAFDDGSAFDAMLKLNFKLLLLGADIQAASMVHYSEQRAAVPYRYWKEFSAKVRSANEWQPRSYKMYVRDLAGNPELRLLPIQESLAAQGQWRSVQVNYGHIACCTLRDFVAATDALLAADPWALVANKPGRVN